MAACAAPRGLVVMDPQDTCVSQACWDTAQNRAQALLAKWQSLESGRSEHGEGDQKRTKAYMATMLFLLQEAQRRGGRPGQEEEVRLSPLRDIIKANGTTVFEFFKATTQVLQAAGRQDWLAELFPDMAAFGRDFQQLEANFIILFILFKKFQKMCSELFRLHTDALAAPGAGVAAGTEQRLFALTWTLFLHTRAQGECADLLPGFYLLLGCLHAVLACRPGAELARLRAGDALAPTEGALLEWLCRWQDVDDRAAAARASERVGAALSALITADKIRGRAGACGREISTDEVLGENCALLEALVRARSATTEVDGLVPLEAPALVGSPPPAVATPPHAEPARAVPQSPQRAGQNRAMLPPPSPDRGARAHATVPRTPERAVRSAGERVAPATPMTAAIRGSRWLSHYLGEEAAAPDAELRRFFSACEGEASSGVGDGIVKRVEELPQLLCISGELSDLGARLYWKSLRGILLREEARLGRSNFGALLADDAMHRALLAICFELVDHALGARARPFPAIPRAFGVGDFEFFVMLENFVRDFDDQLPPGSRKHLAGLRALILDAPIWVKEESPLLSHLADPEAARHFTAPIDAPAAAAQPAAGAPPPSPYVVRAVRLPGVLRPEQRAKSAPTPSADAPPLARTPSADAVPHAQVHKQLACIGRRVWQRAAEVLGALGRALQAHGLSERAQARAAQVMRRILTSARERGLLANRSLHQIVMCVVFGVARVEEAHGVTFRTIIGEHQELFHDEPESLYWCVQVGPHRDQTGNLIEFYNRKFIPACKELLLDEPSAAALAAQTFAAPVPPRSPPVRAMPMAPLPMRTPPASPTDRQVPVRSPMRPPLSPSVRTPVRGHPRVTVSPMRGNALHMTPRTKRLYTFEDTSVGEVDDARAKRMRSAATTPWGVASKLQSSIDAVAPVGAGAASPHSLSAALFASSGGAALDLTPLPAAAGGAAPLMRQRSLTALFEDVPKDGAADPASGGAAAPNIFGLQEPSKK